MRDRPFIAVYIMTNTAHGTLYIGVTSNLYERVRQHRDELLGGFTKRYGLKRLVWYEPHEFIAGAIRREKTLDWKLNLIERENPAWEDLNPALVGDLCLPRF